MRIVLLTFSIFLLAIILQSQADSSEEELQMTNMDAASTVHTIKKPTKSTVAISLASSKLSDKVGSKSETSTSAKAKLYGFDSVNPSSSSFSSEECPLCYAPLQNWGGNFNFSTADVKYPTTTAGVQQLVRACKGKIRPVGTRHSFSEIANTKDTLISMTHMNLILGVNSTVPSVTVQAGITYTDLIPFLYSIGLALPMMASLGEITIAGAIQTGAHGSGAGIGNLATQVLGLQMVLADGSIAQYTRKDTEFAAAVVGLGAVGIITEITLKAQPTFNLAINIFENLTYSYLEEHWHKIYKSGYAVNLFTDFSTPNLITQAWITSKVNSSGSNPLADTKSFFGATAAKSQRGPIDEVAPPFWVSQMGSVGPWYKRLVNYDIGMAGMEGHESQSEYYVAYKHFLPAYRALQTLNAEIDAIAYCGLFRIVEADNLWMSPQYKKRTIGIHFSWRPQLAAVMKLLPKIEAALAPFHPIPHWGKLYTLDPAKYLSVMPKFKKWKAKVESLDPSHKFRNEFLDKNIFVDL